MKIREGAYYRTRGGDVVGPMRKATHGILVSNGYAWYEDGHFNCFGADHTLDLISEVYVSDTPPAVKETEAELREMMRDPRYWQKRDPEWVKRVTEGFRTLVGGDTPPSLPDRATVPFKIMVQETKTLRDEFEMAALTVAWEYAKRGSQSNLTITTTSRLAYAFADEMMEARKK